MADNVAITAGSGTTVATDDVGGAHYQKMKLDAGGDGVAVPVVAGQQTMAASLPVVVASNQSAVPVSDNSSSITVDDGGSSLSVDSTDTWRGMLASEEAANDSDKTFTVTVGQEWVILSIWVELVTTAVVGVRQMSVVITDAADDVLGRIDAGMTQTASLTRNYLFGLGISDLTAFRNTAYLMTPLVPWILPAGYKLRVYDSAAIDAAADDMTVQIMYEYRTV